MTPEVAVAESSIVKFRDTTLEHLYKTYNWKQKRASVECILLACALHDVYAIVTGDRFHWPMVVLFFVNCSVWAWCKWSPRPLWPPLPILVSQIPAIQMIWRLVCSDLIVSGNDDLGWAVAFDFLLFFTLPLSVAWSTVLSIVFCGQYLTTVLCVAENNVNLRLKVSQKLRSFATEQNTNSTFARDADCPTIGSNCPRTFPA